MDAIQSHPLLRRRLQELTMNATGAPEEPEEEQDNKEINLIAAICYTLFFFALAVLMFDAWGRRKRFLADARRIREMAEQSHRREMERLAKRKERREWYEDYFKPCSMEVKETDLFYVQLGKSIETMEPQPETDDEDSDSTACTATQHDSSGDDDSENSDDIESVQIFGSPKNLGKDEAAAEQQHNNNNNTCGACETQLSIRLPVNGHDADTTTCRTVDAQCVICLGDYQAGDKVVWSALECQHAFHDECILPWLSNGKKRCPMCRHWFVPGSPLKSQKKALLLAEMERSAAAGDDEVEVIEDIETIAVNETTVHQQENTTEPQTMTAEVDDQPNVSEEVMSRYGVNNAAENQV